MITEKFLSKVTDTPVLQSLFTNQIVCESEYIIKQITERIIFTMKLLFYITESSDMLPPAITSWTQLYL